MRNIGILEHGCRVGKNNIFWTAGFASAWLVHMDVVPFFIFFVLQGGKMASRNIALVRI